MMNETLSGDSTLESPIIPHHKKSSFSKYNLFLMNYMNLNQDFNKKEEKIDKKENCQNYLEKIIINITKREEKLNDLTIFTKKEDNILDFDLLLSRLFPKKKEKKISPKSTKIHIGKQFNKKLMGYKRKRQIKEVKNNKYNIYKIILKD